MTTSYTKPGVLIGGSDEPLAISHAEASGKTLTVTALDGTVVEYTVDDITSDQSTGRLSFTSSGDQYHIREFREPDGMWLSQYETELPMEALNHLTSGATVEENLIAYALEDSVYIVGLVYTDSVGRWLRTSGMWISLAPENTTYHNDDMIAIAISPVKAAEYIKLYDRNFVTVTDTEEFETSPEPMSDQTQE